MRKNLIAAGAAFAMLSVGMLAPAYAGGGATSAPSKYTNEDRSVSWSQLQNHRQVRTAGYSITEFSSSSAPGTGPKR